MGLEAVPKLGSATRDFSSHNDTRSCLSRITVHPSDTERHRVFPRRSNVQLARVRGPRALDILIWERGAGATSASGTSACAAACAAVRRGLVRSPVAVHSPGGVLRVVVAPDFAVTLDGSVDEVARGRFSDAFVRSLV